MDSTTLELHHQLLRLAKGMLKAWEAWLQSQQARDSSLISHNTTNPVR
jgi:hypothetical protein